MSEAMKVRDKAIKDFDAMWCGKFGFTSDGVKLDGTQITREQLYRYSRTLFILGALAQAGLKDFNEQSSSLQKQMDDMRTV